MGDQPEHEAAILDALGISLLNRGCLDESSKLIAQALKIRRKFFGNDHPATAESLNSDSRVRRERGDYDGATAAVQEALRINRAAFGPYGLPVAVSLQELGIVHLQQGLFAAAERSAIEGLKILGALNLLDTDPNTTRLMDVRARAEAGLGRLADASSTYDALLRIDLKQLGTRNHAKYATHLANLGLVKEALRQPRDAERVYRNAIEIYLNALNRPCHPNLIDAYANLGSLLRAPGATAKRLDEAGNHLREALRLGLKVRGDSHVLVGNDHANLGRWQYDIGRKQGALKNFSAALQIYQRNVRRGGLPDDHFFIAEALTWKGRVLVEGGDAQAAAAAEPLLKDAIRKWPVQRGPASLGEGIAKACLGRALSLQGKGAARACSLLCEGYRIIKGDPAGDPALLARVQTWIAKQGCKC